jgi:hypothetical protein
MTEVGVKSGLIRDIVCRISEKGERLEQFEWKTSQPGTWSLRLGFSWVLARRGPTALGPGVTVLRRAANRYGWRLTVQTRLAAALQPGDVAAEL